MEFIFNVEEEKKKLEDIVKDMPINKVKLMQGLIEDASFMAEQLEILRKHITLNGWSDEYKNGVNQYGKKSSVEADAYCKTLKLYAGVIKQISDQIDTSNNRKEADGVGLIQWLKDNEKLPVT